MPSRVAKFKKSTRRNGRKASRKASRKVRGRRQRGAGSIVVYGLIDSKFNISKLSSPTAGVTGTGGAVTCTLAFSPAVTITNVTFCTHNGSAWGAEKTWNTKASGTGAPVLRTTKPLVAAAPLGTQAKIDSAPIPSLTISTFSLNNLGATALDPAKKDATVNGADGANFRITITTTP
jgi:hypothetical protein